MSRPNQTASAKKKHQLYYVITTLLCLRHYIVVGRRQTAREWPGPSAVGPRSGNDRLCDLHDFSLALMNYLTRNEFLDNWVVGWLPFISLSTHRQFSSALFLSSFRRFCFSENNKQGKRKKWLPEAILREIISSMQSKHFFFFLSLSLSLSLFSFFLTHHRHFFVLF